MYVVGMACNDKTCVPLFVKTGSNIQMEGNRHKQPHIHNADVKRLLLSLREENMLQRQRLLLFNRRHRECWDVRNRKERIITHSEQMNLICK